MDIEEDQLTRAALPAAVCARGNAHVRQSAPAALPSLQALARDAAAAPEVPSRPMIPLPRQQLGQQMHANDLVDPEVRPLNIHNFCISLFNDLTGMFPDSCKATIHFVAL